MWRLGFDPWGWEDPLEKGKAGYLLQYSGLENSMDFIAHGVTVFQMTFTFTFEIF